MLGIFSKLHRMKQFVVDVLQMQSREETFEKERPYSKKSRECSIFSKEQLCQ
jgi:hypothetical protein